MTNSKDTSILKDILGNELTVGKYVAVAKRNRLYIASITKICNVKIWVKKIHNQSEILIYPSDCVVVDGPDAMAYILKGS